MVAPYTRGDGDERRTSTTEPDDAALSDMDPAAFRAAAHVVVDLMADYLRDVERLPGLPAVEPGSLAPQFTARRPTRPSRSRRSSPTTATRSSPTSRTGSTRASWPTSRAPRRLRGSSARCSRPPSGRTRCCGGRRRSATELEEVVVDWLRDGSRPARRRSTACSRTRPRRRRSSRSPRPARPRGPDASRDGLAGPRRAAPPRLRLGRGAQLDRQGGHDARYRSRDRAAHRRRRPRVRDGPDGTGDGHRRGSRGRATSRPRSWRPSGRPRSTADRSRRCHRGHRRARGAVASRRRGVRRRRRAHLPDRRGRSTAGSAPTRSSSTRTSGCSRRSTRRCS